MEQRSTLYLRAINLSWILLLSLLIWVVLMVVMGRDIRPEWHAADFLKYAQEGHLLFYITYINAVVLTLLTSFLFSILYLVHREDQPIPATFGVIFIPVYALLNLVAYGSQFLIIPMLERTYPISGLTETEVMFLSEWVQMAPGTIISKINGLGYAVLAIPSICFGLIFYQEKPPGKIISFLLIINALLCITGLAGLAINKPSWMLGTIFGGVLFTMAIPLIIIHFRRTIRRQITHQ
jgi:hypothetical protein